jgi:hypothetical protein
MLSAVWLSAKLAIFLLSHVLNEKKRTFARNCFVIYPQKHGKEQQNTIR